MTIAQIGIQSISSQGTVLSFKIVSVDNASGEVVVNVKVAVGSISVDKDITVNGYRNQATQDVIDVADSIPTSHITTNTTPRPSEIGVVGASVSDADLGITPPSDLKGSNIE